MALEKSVVLRYRRLAPVVVEAFQIFPDHDWPEWFKDAWNHGPGVGRFWIDSEDQTKMRLVLGTLQGVQFLEWGDWIIRGPQGELEACQPDIFEQTHDLVWEAQPPDE